MKSISTKAQGFISEEPPAEILPETSLSEPTAQHECIPSHHIDKDAIKVIKRLTRYGHTAYLVGGGVRDLLLGRQPKDYDIGTSARPAEIRRLFRNCRLIGRRFRLAHILFTGGKIIEVATFRRDPSQEKPLSYSSFKPTYPRYTYPDHSESVSPSTVPEDKTDLLIRHDNSFGNPQEDAIRRDFTINGLFYDITKDQVIDYVGGICDLHKGIVRTIGRPDVRFREDPIRILRAIKFCAQLDFGLIPELYDSAVDQRFELRRCAPPRLLEDTLRLMRGGAAQRAIYLAWDMGVLNVLFPNLAAYIEDDAHGASVLWNRLAAVDKIVRNGRIPSDTVLLAALLLDPIQEVIEGTADQDLAFQEIFQEIGTLITLPRKMKDRIQRIINSQSRLHQGNPKGLMQRDFYSDAICLYELQSRALGKKLPDWLSRTPFSRKSYPINSRHRKLKW